MTLSALYLLFIKYGLLCFGGGYALVPLLTSDLVQTRHLMTAAEFGRLVAVAQMTPGPIGINTATYVGFSQLGFVGALVGTAGLVTPALLLVLLVMHGMDRFNRSLGVRGALAGLRPGAFGLLLVALVVFLEISVFTGPLPLAELRTWISGGVVAEWRWGVRWLPLVLAVISAVLQIRMKISFLWLMAASAVIGALLIR